MNKMLVFLGFLLCLTAFSSAVRLSQHRKNQMWCVATVSAPNDKLQGFLDFACSQFDCSAIKHGGQCFQPNTLRNHASYALDLFFRARGHCNSEIGTPAATDPSFGGCHYP